MIYEISFWGGPKDGHVETQSSQPLNEIFCIEHSSPLLDRESLEREISRGSIDLKYSKYLSKKISKKKYLYIFSGFL
jgi:hypothetical protein